MNNAFVEITPHYWTHWLISSPNRYVPTNHHTWVSTQHYYNGDVSTRLPPPTARPESEGTNVDDLDWFLQDVRVGPPSLATAPALNIDGYTSLCA